MPERNKPTKKPAQMGRPTKYKPEYNKKAYSYALLGMKDTQIADKFGVSESTLNDWKIKFPEFYQSLTQGKDEADSRVAAALYERALGYSHKAVKIFNNDGHITKVDYTEHYPPDTTAGIFWLKNRQKQNWRDKQELEHSGPDGGPIQHEIDLSKLTDEELALLKSLGDKAKK